jgi:DNA-binding XRE family transcriptional regulator
MGLTFEIKGVLPEHAIRHIIRETEGRMADGADAKATLVQVTQEYLAEQHAIDIKAAIDSANEMAEMMGADADLDTALAEVKAQIGGEYEKAMNAYAGGPTQHLADALAKAAVTAKQVIGANRGKWLAKVGIVADHINALVPATTKPAAPEMDHGLPTEHVEQPEITDPDMRDMLGLAPLPGAPAVLPPPLPAASAGGVAAHPQTPAAVPSAAPPGPDAAPPPAVNPRDAFVLFGEALDMDDAELAKRLGVSRSTIHNYTSGKTSRVKITLAQARVLIAEIDARTAKLRRAAEIFSQVRD